MSVRFNFSIPPWSRHPTKRGTYDRSCTYPDIQKFESDCCHPAGLLRCDSAVLLNFFTPNTHGVTSNSDLVTVDQLEVLSALLATFSLSKFDIVVSTERLY